MRKEDLEAVGKAISIIIEKCHSRVMIEPIEESSCYGCKWENDKWAEECKMCKRVDVDYYERRQDAK